MKNLVGTNFIMRSKVPYEIRLKNVIGKFDKVIILKVLKMITTSKLKNN
jgi:hypothetical protein